MILIHGSGVVRAGQWSRRCVYGRGTNKLTKYPPSPPNRLIINDNLDSGTQLPFIKKAIKVIAIISLCSTINTNYY